jgi:hypothetical protein
MRARRDGITDDQVKAILADGVARAKTTSNQTINQVRTAIGINL